MLKKDVNEVKYAYISICFSHMFYYTIMHVLNIGYHRFEYILKNRPVYPTPICT